jgi:NAD-dependent DNA ligase
MIKIVNMNKDDFLKIEGFKDKLSDKIYLGIKDRLEQSSLNDLMVGSNIFGRGFSEKKMQIILNDLPDILVSLESKEVKVEKVKQIKGMALKTAEAFVQKIDDFKDFLLEIGLHNKLEKENGSLSLSVDTTNVNSNPLFGKKIVLTGSRDKSIIEFIKSVGGEMVSSVSKNTFLVIAKTADEDSDTGKANEARKLNIPILSISEFQNKYMT